MITAKNIRDNNGIRGESATGLGEISDSQIRSRVAELAVTDGRKGEEFRKRIAILSYRQRLQNAWPLKLASAWADSVTLAVMAK
jgi:hypothetical protein